MNLLKKRSVAAVVMAAAVLAGILLGQAQKPEEDAYTTVVGSYQYVMDSEGVISRKTMEHIDAMNVSLFAQTGAQIAVVVVDTTGSMDLADYAEQEFERLGVGARETNNGILLVLALRNMYNGAPDGDYYIAWGSGFSSGEQDVLFDILQSRMERSFAAGDYDGAVSSTFEALIDYLEELYYVTVRENDVPASWQEYTALSGGYETKTTGDVPLSPLELAIQMLMVLVLFFLLWAALDAVRYRRYRRRSLLPGVPARPYYPIFWGRPRRRSPPPPPRRPPSSSPGGGGRPPQPPRSGFGGGSSGGSAGRSGFGGSPPSPPRRPPSPPPGGGGRPPQPPRSGFGGGSSGGSAGRSGFGGSSSGGSAGRGKSGGGSFGGGAGRSGFGGSSSGGGAGRGRSGGGSFGGGAGRGGSGGAGRGGGRR